MVSPRDGAAHGLSFEATVLERLGPFNERVVVGEDTDVARRLGEIGVEVWFEPSVRTAHGGPRGVVAMLRDHHRRGRAAASYWVREPPEMTRREAFTAFSLRWWRELRQNVMTSWRYAGGHRWRLLAALPWLLAARAAAVAGFHRGPVDRPGPSGAGLLTRGRLVGDRGP